jgi:ferredoxin--NADP+ reductase
VNQQPLRVAIVGAGPAGLYAAGQLLEQQDITVEVDVFDRLPTPHGLVRAGVAPDHPEKKLVIDNMFDFYLSHPRVRFFGNIDISVDITHEDLSAWYDAVVYSVGASSDVKLNIPGEDLAGSWAARVFVAWYNGHPDYSHLNFDFSSKRAVIVGNGNVALDIARILTLAPEALRKTDIADYAIEALAKSAIEEVVILGRRSHFQGAFNNPELEELEHLENVDVTIDTGTLNNEQIKLFETIDWQSKRKVETLKRLSRKQKNNNAKNIVLRFLSSPVEIIGDTKVSQLKTVSNRLEGDSIESLKAIVTDNESLIDAGLVLRSIGYRGKPLAGLPFDNVKGVIPNLKGRIVDNDKFFTGAYVTGWIKRGPRGVIGTNKKCADQTVRCLLEDAKNGLLTISTENRESVEAKLYKRKPDLVNMNAWKKIDRVERLRGREQNRPRVKQTQWQTLLQSAGIQR